MVTGPRSNPYSRRVVPELRNEMIQLPDDALEALRDFARRRGVDLTDALIRAIVDEQFLLDEHDQGSKLLLERPDKSRHQVHLVC